MVHAMGEKPVRVACRAEGAKTEVPEGLCESFAERVGATLARPIDTASEPEGADLTLVVLRSDAQTLSARIDTPLGQGEPRAAARRDAALDDAARVQLIDSLLAQTDLP